MKLIMIMCAALMAVACSSSKNTDLNESLQGSWEQTDFKVDTSGASDEVKKEVAKQLEEDKADEDIAASRMRLRIKNDEVTVSFMIEGVSSEYVDKDKLKLSNDKILSQDDEELNFLVRRVLKNTMELELIFPEEDRKETQGVKVIYTFKRIDDSELASAQKIKNIEQSFNLETNGYDADISLSKSMVIPLNMFPDRTSEGISCFVDGENDLRFNYLKTVNGEDIEVGSEFNPSVIFEVSQLDLDLNNNVQSQKVKATSYLSSENNEDRILTMVENCEHEISVKDEILSIDSSCKEEDGKSFTFQAKCKLSFYDEDLGEEE